jgi:hypothetical protein
MIDLPKLNAELGFRILCESLRYAMARSSANGS